MSLVSRFKTGGSVLATKAASNSNTIKMTSEQTQENKITKAIEEIRKELNESKMETLAWIVSCIEIEAYPYGVNALSSTVGKIKFNPTHMAKIMTSEVKGAVEKAVLDALPGLNFGGPTTDRTKLDKALADVFAALDALVTCMDPAYTGPQT